MRDRTSLRVLVTGFVLAAAASAGAVVLQPSSQDAYLRQATPNHVYGNSFSDRVEVQASTSPNGKERGLVQFDLSSIPQFSTITSAMLELWQGSSPTSTARTHGVFKVLAPWLESTVKWNTTPAFAVAPTATQTVGLTRNVFYSFTVTTDVQAWINTPTTNFGWLVKDQTETGVNATVAYVSRDDSGVAEQPQRPKLTVSFTAPSCSTNAQCADANPCTINERCDAGVCKVDPRNCDDSNLCTQDICDPQSGCLNPIGDCNDGFSCTVDACTPDGGCTHTPVPSVCAHSGCQTGTCVADQNDDTLDPVTGCMVTSVAPNGTSCNVDNNACTPGDACQGGECIAGTPVTCGPPGQCQNGGTCNPGTGVCDYPPKPNGTSCNDGSLCTTGEACSAGSCTGGTPVVCTALDQCHVAGTCNPGTGVCSNPTAPNGTGCTDGNACTTSEACDGAGTCTGGTPTICTPSDQCHVAGTCDSGTGLCSNPSAPNGTGCNDGDVCTTTDTCTGGTCGGAPVVCTPSDQCHAAGECDSGTGLCSNPIAPNGTPCNDGNVCTLADECTAGACGGNPSTCGDSLVQTSCGEQCDVGPGGGGDCSPTCQFLCGPTPRTDCVTAAVPQKARLQIKNRTPDTKDLLVWKLSKGNTVSSLQVGTPLTSTGYRLCLWDASANPQPIYSATIAPGGTCGDKPCWKVATNNTYAKFKDKAGLQKGTIAAQVKAGLSPKSKAQWKGKGALLLPPTLPLTPGVTVQLENDQGTCWTTVFAAPLANTTEQFKAKGD